MVTYRDGPVKPPAVLGGHRPREGRLAKVPGAGCDSRMLRAWLASALLLGVPGACAAPAEAPPLAPLGDGMLPAGPWAVGFRSTWELDASRTWRTAFDEGATYGRFESPRPVLVNLWYPARTTGAAAMPRSGYLPPRGGAHLHALVEALARYERDVIAQEVFGAAEAELDAERARAFLEYLARPTRCVRDGEPAEGSFPLVLYHSGAGSSYEDNAELCESLASHGFVVVGSAFPDANGESFNVDGREGSWRDLEFLERWAAALPGVTPGRIAAIGHSAGAQALLRFATVPNSPVDALVILDTTQDYNSTADTRWGFVEPLLAARTEVTEALLLAAQPHAFFEVADQLTSADRRYLTLRDLEHNDFISQGISFALERARLEGSDRNRAQAARLLAGYRELCASITLFLEAELRDSGAARAALEELGRNPLGGARAHLDRMPPGSDAPPPYDEALGQAPSPRQLRAVLARRGAAATAELLQRFRASDGENPVYAHRWFAYALFFELVQREREDDARTLWGFYRGPWPELLDAYRAQIELFSSLGRPAYLEYARACVRTALVLEPGDPGMLRWREQLGD